MGTADYAVVVAAAADTEDGCLRVMEGGRWKEEDDLGLEREEWEC